MNIVNVKELEALAREKLSLQSFDYLAGGAEDENTLRANHHAFQRLQFLPRVLVDVSEVDLGIELLGARLSLPVILAPAAFQGLFHQEAEEATARGAMAAGALFILSSLSSLPLARVAQVTATAPRWYQLYCARQRGVVKALVERAAANGYQALCLTVDVPVVGRREKDIRNGFKLSPEARPADILELVGAAKVGAASGESALTQLFDQFYDASLSWKDLEWLRGLSRMPLVLKGILSAEDARLAVEHGVDAIVVSNHGGRQLDGVPQTIEVLPDIIEAVADRIPVLVDSGFRRGSDVVKALALGARAVLIGRPYLWGLAADGSRGVETVLQLLREEIRVATALLGCSRITDLHPGLLRRI